jgi:hypothetical protein
MQRSCEGKTDDCFIVKLTQATGKIADNSTAPIPIPPQGLVLLAKALQTDFSGYRCHAVQTLLGVAGIPPLGILCISTEDGSCLRMLLNPQDADRLVAALMLMQTTMQAGAAIPPGQVQ